MLEEKFVEVYEKFKINFYKNMFRGLDEGKESLSATETFCVEVINALKRPTINDVVGFLEMSQPNITYKIRSLERKGYIRKIRSQIDRREYYLEVTDKFRDYYGAKNEYISVVLKRLATKVSQEEIRTFERILTIMTENLMPEVTGYMDRSNYDLDEYNRYIDVREDMPNTFTRSNITDIIEAKKEETKKISQ